MRGPGLVWLREDDVKWRVEGVWLCPAGPQGFSVRFGGEEGAVGAVLGATELSGGREASPGRQA